MSVSGLEDEKTQAKALVILCSCHKKRSGWVSLLDTSGTPTKLRWFLLVSVDVKLIGFVFWSLFGQNKILKMTP